MDGALPEQASLHAALPLGFMQKGRPHEGLPIGSVRHPDTPDPGTLPGQSMGRPANPPAPALITPPPGTDPTAAARHTHPAIQHDEPPLRRPDCAKE